MKRKDIIKELENQLDLVKKDLKKFAEGSAMNEYLKGAYFSIEFSLELLKK